MRYFQEKYETMKVDEISNLQDKLIRNQILFVFNNVPIYKNKMISQNISVEDIKGINDIWKLPFTTKDDLKETYPNGFLAVQNSECVRIQSTSGTTGKRVISFYTKKDIDIWEECCARAIVAAGGDMNDICQVSYGYGLFTGGTGLNGGAQKVGCLTLPMSVGNTQRQVQFMADLKSTILCCTPSYAVNIGEYIKKNKMNRQICLKSGIFGAEPWTEEMRKNIESLLNIDAYDIYGLTEIMGPGVAFECSEKKGMHIQEDHFYAEVVDPNTGENLPDGNVGELVLTCLTKKAFPLIRYRTRDLCKLSREKCSCGRTHVRMSKLLGRCDDMIVVKGVNVWPTQIETVLIQLGYSSNYLITIDRIDNLDTLTIEIENEKNIVRYMDINDEEKRITKIIKSILGIKVNVCLVEKEKIIRSERKAIRVVDKRNLYQKG